MTIEVDERIRQHYLLEKSLAQRILASAPENRTQVTIEAYNELFTSIPWHSQLDESEEEEQQSLSGKRLLFGHLIGPNSDILDMGAGTAYWTRYLASKSTSRCVGIDVSKEVLIRRPDDPPNLELYIMDAIELNFPADSFDIAFSSQLIEHLHPSDVERHFASVYRVLRENGVYAFDTPSRLDGPHDISKYFDNIATGFHLKEWTYGELTSQLKKAGFRKIRTMALPWNLVKRLSCLRSFRYSPRRLTYPRRKVGGKY